MPGGHLFMDRDHVLGVLRATGTRDPDVLHALRTSLVLGAGVPRLAGTALLAAGALVSLTAIGPVAGGPTLPGAVIGVPMVLAGWWLRRRGRTTVAAIEAACDEYARPPRPDPSSGGTA